MYLPRAFAETDLTALDRLVETHPATNRSAVITGLEQQSNEGSHAVAALMRAGLPAKGE